MNTDLTTKGVEMFAEMLAKNQLKETLRVERRALEKAGRMTQVTIKVIGVGAMSRFLNHGWSILSESGSNYSHAMPHYVMVKNKEALVLDLERDSV